MIASETSSHQTTVKRCKKNQRQQLGLQDLGCTRKGLGGVKHVCDQHILT